MGEGLFLVAGEVSGDNHGALLIRELKLLDPELKIKGVGGERMAEEGAELIAHIRDLSVVGLVEIFGRLPGILKVLGKVVRHLKRERPGAVVLIDFPDFNMRVARACRRLGIRVFYYISPQVWAWRRGRIKKMKRLIDDLIVILPFEKEFFMRFGLDASYFGHPIVDTFEEVKKEGLPRLPGGEGYNIALIPGSRRSEVRYNLPSMVEAAKVMKSRGLEARFLIPVAPNLERELFEREIQGGLPIHLIEENRAIWRVLGQSDAAIVSSGTATLQTALMRVPMVIIYRMAGLTYLLARFLVRPRYMGLVNYMAGRVAIREFIQNIRPEELAREVMRLLADPDARRELLEIYDEIISPLGPPGVSSRVARFIYEKMGKRG